MSGSGCFIQESGYPWTQKPECTQNFGARDVDAMAYPILKNVAAGMKKLVETLIIGLARSVATIRTLYETVD